MGAWIRGKIRFMFWSMIVSCTLMTIMSTSPSYQKKMLDTVKVLRAQVGQLSQSREAAGEEGLHTGAQLEQLQNMARQLQNSVGLAGSESPTSGSSAPVADETGATSSESSAPHSNPEVSSAEAARGDGEYVLIRGKYYRARADNIYEIDGEKVFFINNRKAEKATEQAARDGDPQRGQASSGRIYQELPSSPGAVLDSIKNLNETMKNREAALKDLAR